MSGTDQLNVTFSPKTREAIERRFQSAKAKADQLSAFFADAGEKASKDLPAEIAQAIAEIRGDWQKRQIWNALEEDEQSKIMQDLVDEDIQSTIKNQFEKAGHGSSSRTRKLPLKDALWQRLHEIERARGEELYRLIKGNETGAGEDLWQRFLDGKAVAVSLFNPHDGGHGPSRIEIWPISRVLGKTTAGVAVLGVIQRILKQFKMR